MLFFLQPTIFVVNVRKTRTKFKKNKKRNKMTFDDKSAKKFATMMRNLFPHYKETVLQKKKWEK